MAEQTFWIIAAIAIIIIVVVALVALFGGQFGPFKSFFFKLTGQQELCRQMAAKGCVNTYMPQLENEQSNIFYDQIGENLRDPNNRDSDVNKARFGEVCEYFGMKNFDECLKTCGCSVP